MSLTILTESHTDHVSPEIIDYVKSKYEGRDNPGGKVVIETIDLPEGLDVPCRLHGLSMGDLPVSEADVYYGPRGGRPWASRLVNRPARRVGQVTVVAGPFGGHDFVLYTCYGGPAAPREVDDPGLDDGDELAAAKAFWSSHALADE